MKTVTFLYKYGHPDVDVVPVGHREYRRFEPVTIRDDEYMTWIKSAWGYRFDVSESLVTDVIPSEIEYSPALAEGDITAIIPQFKTPVLTYRAVNSFKTFYPDVPLIVVDDGSQDASTALVRGLPECYPATSVIILPKNVGHGAALHEGIKRAMTRRVFTMDSDVTVHRGGFLELMESRMIEADLYAIGMMYWRDYQHENVYLTYVASLYDREVYFTLPPFVHDGDPMQQNMDMAAVYYLRVECFPITDYVTHDEAGTRSRLDPAGRAWDFTGGKG